MFNILSVRNYFFDSLVDHCLTELIIQLEVVYYFNSLWIFSQPWKWDNNIRRDLRITIARTIIIESETLPVVTAKLPISHLINCSFSSWCSCREFPQFNYFNTSILHRRYEILLNPLVGDDIWYVSIPNHSVSNIRVYGMRIISPDYDLGYICKLWLSFKCKCRYGSIVVQSRQRRKMFFGNTFRLVTANQAIRVLRWTHH